MTTPIDQLAGELWGCCVMQCAAEDQEMAERWHSDEMAYLKEGFLIQAMPAKLCPLVEKAMSQWEDIETGVFSGLQMDKEQFLQRFENARQDFLSGDKEWEKIVASVRNSVRGAVRNMDWVNLFSWVLPKADPENFDKHRAVGQIVVSIFYTELLLKHGKNSDRVNGNPLGRIEARWGIVTQTGTIEERILFSINQVVKQFQANPYILLCESDIQCALFAELRKNITETVKISSVTNSGQEYEISIIHSEYRNKIDLVCLDTKEIETFEKTPFKKFDTYIYNLPILVGIELKYVTMGYAKDISISQDDYNKLQKLKDIKNKLAICFLQHNEQANTFCKKAQETHSIQSLDKINGLGGIFIVTPSEIWCY